MGKLRPGEVPTKVTVEISASSVGSSTESMGWGEEGTQPEGFPEGLGAQ